MRGSRTARVGRAVLFTVVMTATAGGALPSLAGSFRPEPRALVVCATAAPGCDVAGLRVAIDRAVPGDVLMIRPGAYRSAVEVDVRSVTLCAAGPLGCSSEVGAVVLDGGDVPALTIAAPGVSVAGLRLRSTAAHAVVVDADGARLRRNVIEGRLEAIRGVVDARVNHWGTDSWTAVAKGLPAGGATVLASPLLRRDLTLDPPAPTVTPSGHCSSVGFSPRFIEEGFWCAHADGTVVLHPSNNLVSPTPHQPAPAFGSNPAGNLIDRNRGITGVDIIGEPQWVAGFGAERLDRITVCSGDEVVAAFDPPAPNGGPCTGAFRSRTIVTTAPTVHTVLHMLVSQGRIRDLTLQRLGAPTASVVGLDLAGSAMPTIADNVIRLEGGGCSSADISAGSCHRGGRPQVTGISAGGSLSGAQITGNTVAADAASADGTIGGTNGLSGNLTGSTISSNTFRAWGANGAFLTGGSNATVSQNTFDTNGDGLTVCASNATVTQNTFRAHASALSPCAPGLVANRNDFSAGNALGVRFVGSGLTVDARRNHWGRYTRDSVSAAISKGAADTIEITCFLAANGDELCPPQPRIDSPTAGQTFTFSPVTVSGSNAEGGADVSIRPVGGSTLRTTTADAAGRWSAPVNLPSGTHTLEAVARKATGGIVTQSLAGASVTFSVDLTPVLVSVNCNDITDDIGEIQRVADILTPGGTLKLTGVCDFSPAGPARPSGSADAFPEPRRAGVLIRTPGITITPLNINGVTIVGSGDENAFTVAPNADDVTFDGTGGFRFVGLGQPIRVLGADGVTVRDVAVSAEVGTWAAVLAEPYASAGSIRFGTAGSDGLGVRAAALAADPVLAGFNAVNNRVNFTPASAGTTEAVGVGVADAGIAPGTVTGLNVSGNVIDFQAAGAPRLLSPAGVRLNLRNATATAPVVDANTITGAAAGIVIERASAFQVRNNALDVTLSNSAGSLGGGVLVTDSDGGDVASNTITVRSSGPAAPASDFGGIGIVDDADTTAPTSAATRNVRLRDNTITSPGRGVLLNGTSRALVATNTVTGSPAAAIGQPLTGGLVLDGTVTDSVVCRNTLGGGADAAAHVSAANVTSSAFPGGTGLNAGCVPTISFSPTIVRDGQALTVSGVAWPNRDVRITLSDSTSAATAVRIVTASSNGSYSDTFPYSAFGSFGEATHTGAARASDGAVSSVDAAGAFQLDRIIPNLALLLPANGSAATDDTPVLSGTAGDAAGDSATVTVKIWSGTGTAGLPLHTLTTVRSGAVFSVDSLPLADGTYTARAEQTDAANNTGLSGENTFVVDRIAPIGSTTFPSDGSAHSAASWAAGCAAAGFCGSASDDRSGVDAVSYSLQRLSDSKYWNGSTFASASQTFNAVSGTTTWSAAFPVTAFPADGLYRFSLRVADRAGNSSTSDRTFRIDLAAPTAGISFPSAGLHDTFAWSSGCGSPAGDFCGVAFDGGAGLASVRWSMRRSDTGRYWDGAGFGDLTQTMHTANGTSSWGHSFDIASFPSSGTYELTAVARDVVGNQSAPVTVSFQVKLDIDAPVILTPAEGAITRASPVGISGSAEPNSTVRVYNGAVAPANLIGTTATTNAGLWGVSVTLPEGSHTVSATATNVVNQTSPASTRSFTIDRTAPPAPVFITPSAGSNWPTTTIGVSGTSEPLATIEVVDNSGARVSVVAQNDGNWNTTMTLPRGSRLITATARDAAGNVGPSASRAFDISGSTPAPPLIVTPSEHQVLNATVVGVSGTSESGAAVEIFEGNTKLGQTTAVGSNWSLELTFAPGSHSIRARAIDGSSVVSEFSPVRAFTVDLAADGPPQILSPVQDALVGANVTVQGTAKPGTAVRLYEGTSLLGSVVVGGSGRWSLGRAFTNGEHTVFARAVPAGGGTDGPASASRRFEVDAAPPTVEIARVDAQAGGPVTVTGAATDNRAVSRIELRFVDAVTGIQVAQANATCTSCGSSGAVSWTHSRGLTTGYYRVEAVAVDTLGNRSTIASRTFLRV